MSKTELTKGEAYAVAEFIDMNIFTAIRTDEDWDSFQNLRNLCHAYEKCCAFSGYVGVTDCTDGAIGAVLGTFLGAKEGGQDES